MSSSYPLRSPTSPENGVAKETLPFLGETWNVSDIILLAVYMQVKLSFSSSVSG